MEIVLNGLIKIGTYGISYNQETNEIKKHCVTSYSVLYSESKHVKTTAVTYYTSDGYVFTNILEEPKITDLFLNVDDLNHIKSYLYHQAQSL